MAWTEADRATIRAYLGFPALFLQADPSLGGSDDLLLARADAVTSVPSPR